MTSQQVRDALEACANTGVDKRFMCDLTCDECPYSDDFPCAKNLVKDALRLVKSQDARIAGLSESVTKKDRLINRLTAERDAAVRDLVKSVKHCDSLCETCRYRLRNKESESPCMVCSEFHEKIPSLMWKWRGLYAENGGLV